MDEIKLYRILLIFGVIIIGVLLAIILLNTSKCSDTNTGINTGYQERQNELNSAINKSLIDCSIINTEMNDGSLVDLLPVTCMEGRQ